MKGTLKTLYFLLAIAISLVAIGIITYTAYNYGGEPKTADFGHFGSFIGGISSTLLGATTSLFLLYQLSKMDHSIRQQEQDRKISEAFNRLYYYDKCINDLIKLKFAEIKNDEEVLTLTFGGLIGEETYISKFDKILEKPNDYHIKVFKSLAAKYVFYSVACTGSCNTLFKHGYIIEARVHFGRLFPILKGIHERAIEWGVDEKVFQFGFFEKKNKEFGL
tara:strand:+ start:8928 stop:9587 length:660 start_codon:yes stop_codon:yes gene_type:complete